MKILLYSQNCAEQIFYNKIFLSLVVCAVNDKKTFFFNWSGFIVYLKYYNRKIIYEGIMLHNPGSV